MDPITDIFRTMQIRAVVHARLEATATWGLEHVPAEANKNVKGLSVSPAELAFFGMIARGNCWLSLDGIPDPIALTGGDCFLLSPENTYALRDHPRTRPQSFCQLGQSKERKVIHY